MRKLIFLLLLFPVLIFGQTTLKRGVQIGRNGSVLDTGKVEGLNLNFYNSGNTYTVGISSPDTLYDISFQDETGSYVKNLLGNIEANEVNHANAMLGKGNLYTPGDFELENGGNWAYKAGLVEAQWTKEVTNGTEAFDILSASNDTIYIDGVWTLATGIHQLVSGYFLFRELQTDTNFYGTTAIHNLSKDRSYNQMQSAIDVNNNYGIVSKVGGMMWRADNWLGSELNSNMTAISNWVGVLDKYHFKATLGLNEGFESEWDRIGTDGILSGDFRKYAKFWKDLQSRGHDIAGHSPAHLNYKYIVYPDYLVETADIPGIESVTFDDPYYTIVVDTINGIVRDNGFDIMLWRGQEMFKYIGLNPYTYWIEAGGQPIYYDSDSIYTGSYKNLSLGGGKYEIDCDYQHAGFNPPLDWAGKSEYFMNWNNTESISLETSGNAVGTQDVTAVEAIKKLTDQSARHTLTIFRQHVQYITPDQWYLSCMDSILYFVFSKQAYIRNFTGTQAAKTMYQSQTNPHLNYIPANPITGQCFEDNIDSTYGDTMPDGWTIGADAAYWEDGGSQGSKGYVSVGTGETTNLYLTRLYGIEKGVNTFTIDIKDKEANDFVNIELTYHHGDTYPTLASTEIQLQFASTGAWVTYSADVTFPYNTSFVDIQVWAVTAESYVDELTLKKKY